MGKQIETLEHHADFAPYLVHAPQIRTQFDAVDDDLAFLKLLERVDAADQRRFARARRAADHDALAFSDIEVDVAQYVKIAVPLVEAPDVDDRVLGHGDFSQLRWCAFRRRSTNR